MSAAGLAPRLLTREEAAAYLGMKLTFWKEHVQSKLTPIRVGKRAIFYDVEELDRWVENQKRGSSGSTATSGTSASDGKGDASSERLAKEIRAELEKSLRKNTRKLFPVGQAPRRKASSR